LFNYESLEEFQLRVDINANKELLSVFDEILESKNEERRKPKCPKGTRDMTPL